MKAVKALLMMATTVAITGLYGCGGGDETTINYTVNGSGSTGGGTVGGPSTCPSWTQARSQINGQNVCQLPDRILEDRLLTADTIWYMVGTVKVGNGEGDMSTTPGILADTSAVVAATLTIEAGTSVVGQNDSFANLVITRGSKIDAVGTATNPIVFSSADDDLLGSGEWGGIILHGYGVHNKCIAAPGPCNVDSEGNSGKAGGYDNADDSGRMRYVIVAEGGFEFGPGNEINGVSFVSVGSGTEVSFLQVNGNADDGVEFYGGAVNAKNLVLTGNRDDSVDWDEGWQGNLQFILVVQDDALTTEGNAIEADTEGSLALGIYSTPTIANATFVGGGSQSTLWVFKASSGGFLLNTVGTFANNATFPEGSPKTTTCVNVVDAGSAANVGNRLDFNNVITGCDVFGNANGNANGLLPDALQIDPDLDVNYAAQAAQASGVPLDVAGFVAGNAAAAASTDVSFFEATNYIGAVDPAAATAWFEGWTIDGSL
jgi:hypothetical protein